MPYMAWLGEGDSCCEGLPDEEDFAFISTLALLRRIYEPDTAALGSFFSLASFTAATASSILAWFSFSCLLFCRLSSMASLRVIIFVSCAKLCVAIPHNKANAIISL